MHQDSIVPRINIWKGSINIIKSNPIYGIGLNNYTLELDKQIRSKQIAPIKNNPDNPSAGMNHAHNQYLDVYVKTGLAGLLLLIYFVYSHYIFYKYKFSIEYNTNNHISMLGNVALICFCIIMLFNTILAHQQLTIFMVFIMMTLSALKSNILWPEDKQMNITVIGTGYVGLVTGTCFAEVGHNVICLDKDIPKINKLKKGIIPIYEPKLDSLVKSNYKDKRLNFTTSYKEAINSSDIIFIAGRYSL